MEQAGFGPSFVVAPYFYMEGNTVKEWLSLNFSFGEDGKAIAAKCNVPLAVQIVVSENVLCDSGLRQAIIERYSSVKPDAFLLWIDSFSEQQGSESALGAFAELAAGLGKTAPVVNLYGGFFSVMLLHMGVLSGVAHGLEYGEDRSVKPVGGGIPVAKYYLPALHARLSFRTAVRAVRALGGMRSAADFHARVCGCGQCNAVVGSNPDENFIGYGRNKVVKAREYPLPETKNKCVRHYMLCKAREFSTGADVQQVLSELESSSSALRKELGTENTEHCRAWAQVLSKVVS